MPAPEHTYALILAGGSGTRFWPLSRNRKPKQLLDLFDTGTLLEQAISRLEGLVPTNNIFILTNALQSDGVRECASMLPPENIIAEPAKRDTAPAVALGVGLITARDPEAVMMVLPADQMIRDTDGFREVMRDALATAEHSDGLVTIGIQPTWPCPSYGYIERGEAATIDGLNCKHPPHHVKRFREKPSPEVAESFLRQGGFSWNAGMFVWKVQAVTGELRQHAPELAGFIDELAQSSDLQETIRHRFPSLPARSIDYALMEHSQCVYNIEADFDWDDVGSWISVAKYLQNDDNDNRANQAITQLDAKDNIVFNARPDSRIALLGVDDLIVVQTEDALLIAKRDQADAIKKLTDQLPESLL